jgi:hypothetical protein
VSRVDARCEAIALSLGTRERSQGLSYSRRRLEEEWMLRYGRIIGTQRLAISPKIEE